MIGTRTVLFVAAENDPRARAAVEQLTKAVARFGLRWLARAVTPDGPTDDTTVVVINRAEWESALRQANAAVADRAIYWSIPPGAGGVPLIEKEVAGLIAQLLGGKADAPPAPPPPTKPEPLKKVHTVKLSRETAGRKGKGVTVVTDLPLDETALQTLATTLKNRCGTGGTAKDGRIEIQGDQRDRIAAELEKLGYKVKRAGG